MQESISHELNEIKMEIIVIVIALNIGVCVSGLCMLYHEVTKVSNNMLYLKQEIENIAARMDMKQLEEMYSLRLRLEEKEQYEAAAKVSQEIHRLEKKYEGRIKHVIEKNQQKD